MVYQNTTLFYTFRPSSSVSHRRDISTFLDNLMVYTMKTIYVLNAYHLGWSSWVPGSPEPPGPPWPPDHSLTPGSPGPPRQPFRAGCKPVQPIGPSPCQPCHLVILVKVVTLNFLFRNCIVYLVFLVIAFIKYVVIWQWYSSTDSWGLELQVLYIIVNINFLPTFL